MKRKPNGYWTDTRVKEEIKKYKSVKEICIKNSALRSQMYLRDFKRLIPKSFYKDGVPKGTWNLSTLKNEAIKYKTIKDFIKGNKGAYSAAFRLGLINKICKHMIPIGNGKDRIVYAIEFDDRSVYIGMTADIKNRIMHHRSKPFLKDKFKKQEYKIKKSKPFKPTFINSLKEEKWIKKYKLNKWQILNKIKGGGMGWGPNHTT